MERGIYAASTFYYAFTLRAVKTIRAMKRRKRRAPCALLWFRIFPISKFRVKTNAGFFPQIPRDWKVPGTGRLESLPYARGGVTGMMRLPDSNLVQLPDKNASCLLLPLCH